MSDTIPDRPPISPDFYDKPEDDAYNEGRQDGMNELADAIEDVMDEDYPADSLATIALLIDDVRNGRL